MSSPLYQEMMANAMANNPMAMLNQLVTNPIDFALQHKYNIPSNLSHDPTAMIQHLLNSGQISQDYYNQTIQRIQMAPQLLRGNII